MIAILGPGAVGGSLAVQLSRAGERVVCIGRTETTNAIRRNGITLARMGEELHARPEAAEALREPAALLLITVKAPGLEEALARIEARAETVIPFLNGLEHMDVIRAQLGGHVIAGTIGLLEAYRESPTRIVQTTPGPVATVAEPVKLPGLEVRVMPERQLLWDKLARIAPLAAATSATGRTAGELRSDPEWRARLGAAIDETCAVANAAGANVTAEAQWAVIEAVPETMTTSAARDVAAGRPSELDAIIGAVVRAGKRLDVPTPTLEALLEETWRAQSR